MWPGDIPRSAMTPPPDQPAFTPQQIRRLDFLRWLVRTGQLDGDTAPDTPAPPERREPPPA